MATKPLTKVELVAEISNITGADKKSTVETLDALCDVIVKTVSRGGAVALSGVGKFHARDRAARTVRNPATGQSMHKAADKAVKVTVAKAFKDAVNR